MANNPDAMLYSADYRKMATTVYTDFPIHQFIRSGQFGILPYLGLSRTAIAGLPSWDRMYDASEILIFRGLDYADPEISSGARLAHKSSLVLRPLI